MRSEREIRRAIRAARERRDHLKRICHHYTLAVVDECEELAALRRELRDNPRQLYFSNLTSRAWPADIVRLITDYCGIAEKLYLSGLPSDRLLIQPRTLCTLHIKHCLQSRAVLAYYHELYRWFKLNAITVSAERPRWKRDRCIRKASMEEMAAVFPTPRFTVGQMTLTLLGKNGILEVDAGPHGASLVPPLHLGLSGLKHSTLLRTRRGCVIPYRPVHPQVRVVYGGRRGMQRLVKVYENIQMH